MKFIHLAAAFPYKLVVSDSGINGIATRSDLLKLPVRLLAFAFVAHLETIMADVINMQCGADHHAWLSVLSFGRQRKVFEKQQMLKAQRMEPPLLELTDLCDKRDIIRRMCHAPEAFYHDMRNIEQLRNALSHAAAFIKDKAGAVEFAATLELTEKWINHLRTLLEKKRTL